AVGAADESGLAVDRAGKDAPSWTGRGEVAGHAGRLVLLREGLEGHWLRLLYDSSPMRAPCGNISSTLVAALSSARRGAVAPGFGIIFTSAGYAAGGTSVVSTLA